MILVERHIINNKHIYFNECDNLCFKSKNLYNELLYNIRQHFFKTKKYLNFNEQYHLIKNTDSYKNLPGKVSNQIIKLIDKNYKSFFKLLIKKLNCGLPKYLDKTNGRYIIIYEKQAISTKSFKKDKTLHLSKTNIFVKTQIDDFKLIKEVRIVPKNNHYIIEVVYNKLEKVNNNNVISALDCGLKNLATITFNNGKKPLIIKGGVLKSINQYYNNKKAKYSSELKLKQKKHKSKKIINLTNKRHNKINDYMHKASRKLVNYLVSTQVGTLILGKNTGQKQNINLGKQNNQNFTEVPIFRFLDMVSYKARLEGIKIIWQEESYTSKCSFLDNEEIKKHSSYLGKRKHRGMFISCTGKQINADVNGSYNILRKAIPDFKYGIEGFAVNPKVLLI